MAQGGMGFTGRGLHLGVLAGLSRLFGAVSFLECVGNGASGGWGAGSEQDGESPYLVDIILLIQIDTETKEHNLTVIV